MLRGLVLIPSFLPSNSFKSITRFQFQFQFQSTNEPCMPRSLHASKCFRIAAKSDKSIEESKLTFRNCRLKFRPFILCSHIEDIEFTTFVKHIDRLLRRIEEVNLICFDELNSNHGTLGHEQQNKKTKTKQNKTKAKQNKSKSKSKRVNTTDKTKSNQANESMNQ